MTMPYKEALGTSASSDEVRIEIVFSFTGRCIKVCGYTRFIEPFPTI
jgi:hypothetical protein